MIYRCKFIVVFIIALLRLDTTVKASNYYYQQFTQKDQLPSNICHDVIQDHDGFLWIATENGIAKYDGRNFANFGINHGLLGNEVLHLFVDSKNRLWFLTFNNTLSFIENDKVYPGVHLEEFDSAIEINDFRWIEEAENGDIIFVTRLKKYWFNDRLNLLHYTQNDNKVLIKESQYSKITSANADVIYEFDDYALASIQDSTFLISPTKDKLFSIQTSELLCSDKLNDSLVYFSYRKGGCRLFNYKSLELSDIYLANTIVHDMLIDREGIFWFSTYFKGLMQLNDINITYASIEGVNEILRNLITKEDTVWALGTRGQLKKFTSHLEKLDINKNNRVQCFYEIPFEENSLFHFTNINLRDIYKDAVLKGFEPLNHLVIKSAFRFNGQCLFASNLGVYNVKKTPLPTIDTIYNKRATCALYANGVYYIGTPKGLFISKNHRIYQVDFMLPALQDHIVDMALDGNQNVWIATHSHGVVGFNGNHRIFTYLSAENTLLSNNLIRAILTVDSIVLVATNEGLDYLSITNNKVSKNLSLTKDDGYFFPLIDAVNKNEDDLFIVSDGRLIKLPFKFQPSTAATHLLLKEVNVIGPKYDYNAFDGREVVLPKDPLGLTFKFTPLSFRSIKGIKYKYRLLGHQEVWEETNNNYAHFGMLNSGEYIFEVIAINDKGIESNFLQVPFVVHTAFWKVPWLQYFITAILISAIAIGWIKVIKYKAALAQKTLNQKMHIQELEHSALRAQMNPHFIFNALNSIQNFILDKDAKGANYYLTRFAKLIRQTLNFSGSKTILLKDEIEYLGNYLQLEHLLHNKAFNFKFNHHPFSENYALPVMVVQPFVENAIKHGLDKRSGEGSIVLTIVIDERIRFIIQDWGTGLLNSMGGDLDRKKMGKGILITLERIEMWNKTNNVLNQIQIVFSENEGGLGTKIELTFPLLLKQ